MSIFNWLLINHLIGDWVLQTNHQASRKAKGNFLNGALISHSLVYTLVFTPTLLIMSISLLWLVPIFLSHLVLDRRTIVYWILRNIKRVSEEEIPSQSLLIIMVDQSLHLLILAVISSIAK